MELLAIISSVLVFIWGVCYEPHVIALNKRSTKGSLE